MGDANWKKSRERVFCFIRNEIEVAQLELVSDRKHAFAKIRLGDEQYLLKRTGFWKMQFEIENSHGKIVLKNYPEKWYSGNSLVECNNIQYKLSVRNNPLAEWVIFDDKGTVILAYGLDAINNKIVARRSSIRCAIIQWLEAPVYRHRYTFAPKATNRNRYLTRYSFADDIYRRSKWTRPDN